MIFEAGGKRYSVERHFHGTRGSDSFKLYSLESGEQMSIDCQVGEYFLGVPREVFESSACIGQMRTADINGEKTMSAIENLLVSADESVDAAKVVASLDKVRTEYMHKNEGGGKLYRLGLEIAETRERYKTVLERDSALKEQKQKLLERERELAEIEAEYKKADKLYGEIRAISLISQFDRLHRAEAELEKIRKAKAEFLSGRGGNAPERRELDELCGALNEYKKTGAERDDAKAALSAAKADNSDSELVNRGREFRTLGGEKALASIAEDLQKKAMGKKKTAVLCFVLAVVLAFAAAVFGYLALVPYISIPATAFLAVVFVALGIVNISLGKKTQARFAEALMGQSDVSALREYVKMCENALNAYEKNREKLSKAEGIYEMAQKRYADSEARLVRLLGNTERPEEKAEEMIALLEGDLSKYNKLISEESRFAEAVRAIGEPIAEYDEEELRGSIESDISEITEKSLSEVSMKRKFYETKLDAIRQGVRNISNAVSQLEANSQDPLVLADRCAELEAEARESREYYDALLLAIDSIKAAGERMQGNFTPEISRRAGDMVSIISKGRYNELTTGKKLQPSLIQNGLPVVSELLSGGTRDAVYISLRIALMSRIFDGEMPPLIMDESLCQFDDSRAERMVMLLSELVNTGMQMILFTCHNREESICNILGVPFNSSVLN
jgi:hypothetical protein